MKIRKLTRLEAKRLFRLCMIDGVLGEDRVKAVVAGIAASGRRDRFALLTLFRRLVRVEWARHAALIESAAPLSAELLSNVESGLVRSYGKGLRISYSQSPSLIGGMRIKVGSDVYDGTVRARLDALEARL